MRVTVQNGSLHGISRAELEAMLPLFPAHWREAVRSITLCQGVEQEALVSYHAKEGVVAFHWPTPGSASLTKRDSLAELLVSLAAIAERREVPRKMAKALRERLSAETSALRATCEELLVNHGA